MPTNTILKFYLAS